jgi:hypothetical protein
VDAMKRTTVVAIHMGVEATLQELIPYLTSYALSSNAAAASSASASASPPPDEILLLLGQELIKVCEFLGPNHIAQADLLPLLERLASIEETVVRDQAVIVFRTVADQLLAAAGLPTSSPSSSPSPASSTSTTIDAFDAIDASSWVSVIKRLAAADWFTAKVSAAGIIPSVIRLVLASQSLSAPGQPFPPTTISSTVMDLLNIYIELASDETPMVRRSAAQHWGQVANAAGWLYLRSDPPTSSSSSSSSSIDGPSDVHDHGTTTTMAAAAALSGGLLGGAGGGGPNVSGISPRQGGVDASTTTTVTAATPPPILQILLKLVADEQDSVRLLAVASLADVGLVFSQYPAWTIQHWLPLVREGSTDLSWYVKSQLLFLLYSRLACFIFSSLILRLICWISSLFTAVPQRQRTGVYVTI